MIPWALGILSLLRGICQIIWKNLVMDWLLGWVIAETEEANRMKSSRNSGPQPHR